MNDVIKSNLIELCDEFKRAGGKYPALYHQQLFVAPDLNNMSDEWWRAFATANSPAADGGWQEWHGPVAGSPFDWYGRVFGSAEGVREYKVLAECLFLVLREIDVHLSDEGGYEATLARLHEIANEWCHRFCAPKRLNGMCLRLKMVIGIVAQTCLTETTTATKSNIPFASVFRPSQ